METQTNLQKGNLYLIIAIIVGVVAIGATGFASWKYFGGGSELEKNGNEIVKPLIEKETEKVETVSEKTDLSSKDSTTEDWKTYRNEEYGFEISFPKRWKDYRVSKKDTRMTFKLKHQDGNYHDVFDISVYTKEQWNKIQSGEGPKPVYLSEDKKTDRIFAYSIGHDDEGYLGFPNIVSGKVYQGPYYDVQNKIIQTFKVIETNWQTYKNKEYGFSLNFPLLWKEYKTNKRMLNWGAFGTSDSIDFGLPAQDSLFNISMHTKSQWKNIISEEGPRPTYIKENGKFVFAYAITQDAVNNEMVERIKEIESIVSTFKFTKADETTSVKILSPNGGEKWKIGNSYLIRWNSVGSMPQVKIYLVPVNSDIGIRYISYGPIANTGSYTYAIPYCGPGHECSSNFEIPKGKYYIRITDSEGVISDQSDTSFSIVSN